MSYEQRQAISGTRQLLLEEQSGRRNELFVKVVTNYEQNTDENNPGEYRPTTGKDDKGNDLPRSLIYFEVPKDDPRIKRATESGGTLRINGNLENADYLKHTITDGSGKKYLLGGIMDQNGKVIPTGVAGAALQNNFANYNAGKPGSDFTKNTLRLGQLSTGQAAGINAINSGQRKLEDSDVLAGTAGLSQGTAEEIAARRQGLPSGGGESDVDRNPSLVVTTGKDPVTITTKKGVIGFDEKKQYKYPTDMIDNHTDYLLISVREYTPVGGGLIRSRGEFDSTKGKSSKKHKGSIILPIPANIQDGNSVKYGDSSLDGLTAAGAEAALGAMTANIDIRNVSESIKNIGNALASPFEGKYSDMKEIYTRSLAAQAANVIGLTPVTREQLLARESGGILNPNTELLFSGVTLRTFKFSFKITPRSEPEATEVKSIIRIFKSNMAAKTATSESFLSTPNVFDLTYMSGNEQHPFLHSFKTCALTDMSVNYTGEGLYATYGGKEKSPVSMVMDLTFKELEAIYDEDYEKVDKGVGY